VLFKYESGDESEAQIAAFEDTWHWNMAAALQCHFQKSGEGKEKRIRAIGII
jgi:hypothetical protein